MFQDTWIKLCIFQYSVNASTAHCLTLNYEMPKPVHALVQIWRRSALILALHESARCSIVTRNNSTDLTNCWSDAFDATLNYELELASANGWKAFGNPCAMAGFSRKVLKGRMIDAFEVICIAVRNAMSNSIKLHSALFFFHFFFFSLSFVYIFEEAYKLVSCLYVYIHIVDKPLKTME